MNRTRGNIGDTSEPSAGRGRAEKPPPSRNMLDVLVGQPCRSVCVGEDGIVGVHVLRGTKLLFHGCCDCGLRHRIEFEWPEDGVVMKWTRLPNAEHHARCQASPECSCSVED